MNSFLHNPNPEILELSTPQGVLDYSRFVKRGLLGPELEEVICCNPEVALEYFKEMYFNGDRMLLLENIIIQEDCPILAYNYFVNLNSNIHFLEGLDLTKSSIEVDEKLSSIISRDPKFSCYYAISSNLKDLPHEMYNSIYSDMEYSYRYWDSMKSGKDLDLEDKAKNLVDALNIHFIRSVASSLKYFLLYCIKTNIGPKELTFIDDSISHVANSDLDTDDVHITYCLLNNHFNIHSLESSIRSYGSKSLVSRYIPSSVMDLFLLGRVNYEDYLVEGDGNKSYFRDIIFNNIVQNRNKLNTERIELLVNLCLLPRNIDPSSPILRWPDAEKFFLSGGDSIRKRYLEYIKPENERHK